MHPGIRRKTMSAKARWPPLLIVSFLLVLLTNTAGHAENREYLTPDTLALQGSWVRNDAPYILELKLTRDNTLQATYFNRRFIHVKKTETTREKGLSYIMVELEDVNYQGSVYLLSYDRKQDALQGIYIHGASGQRFQVSFSRKAA